MNYNNIEILFAEDSLEDAMLTIRALEKNGLANKLYHVKDGAETLDFMYCKGIFTGRNINERPKVIFLDLKMPKITGLEVLEKLKSDPEMRSIPIVILSSSNEDPDIRRSYALGANSYVVKPLESDNFLQVIKEIGLYWVVRSQPVGN